ncbi:MAG: hypothetical protein R2710_03510 [Acidimicrobiales bacterium]
MTIDITSGQPDHHAAGVSDADAQRAIGIVGTGYVGLVTAVALAELGHHVRCLDIDAPKIERLRRGEPPFYEPGLADLLKLNGERLTFTTDASQVFSHCRIVFVTVDTPPLASGDADLCRSSG